MSGISSTLSISKTAISAQQAGLAVTGQNIANVNNPDYSVQNADQKSMRPALYAGFLFGTGVDVSQIQQNVDKLLEQRLTGLISEQASFGEQESYMRILEGFFNPNSETSISTVMTEFWNAWHDLSDNPLGSSERVAVFESGEKLASRFESTILDMQDLAQDINADIEAAVGRVNAISEQIAVLNQQIMASEINRTANDLRDQRHRLVDELGELIDIDSFERPDGTIIVNIASSYTIVNGVDSYDLDMVDQEIVWATATGTGKAITDDIVDGQVGGLLEMRDETIPKYITELNELAREMIWAINYQHSQGVGLEYFKDPVTGDYATDDSRWLTSFEFGDKIDFSKEFTMWIEDKTTSDTQYVKSSIDMGISEARITNWDGMTPGGVQSIYKLTVVDEGVLGDNEVIESDGDGLAIVHGSTVDAQSALAAGIAAQTIYVYNGPDGTHVIEVDNNGGETKQSAASIAQALNEAGGVQAFASETHLAFDLTGGFVNAEDGDTIKFSLFVDGLLQEQSFIRDSNLGTMDEQFEEALLAVAATVNGINENDDLYAEGLTIVSSSGATLGVQDFEVQDNTGIRLDAFNFNPGDTVSFNVETMQGILQQSSQTVTLTLDGGIDTTDQAALSEAFSQALSAQLGGGPVTVEHDPYTNSVILRSTTGTDIRLIDNGGAIGGSIDITALSGSVADGANVDNVLDFTGVGDVARFNTVSLDADS
ncbi:MAG: flagellar hook-associated protein FlgK, partial [Desulfobacteraceae bacterium]